MHGVEVYLRTRLVTVRIDLERDDCAMGLMIRQG